MALREWWTDKLSGTRAAGIEVQLTGTSLHLDYVFVEVKHGKLGISLQASAASITEVKLPAGAPVNISITGKGILIKKISYIGEMDTAALLQKVLPNAKPSEFYVQHTSPVNGNVTVAVARRSSIDELLSEFMKNKIEVVSCTLGPLAISSVLPGMNLSSMIQEEIRLPGYTISVTDGMTSNCTAEVNNDTAPLAIGDERISSSYAIAYASAVSYFTGSDIVTDRSPVEDQAEEFRQKKKFQYTGAVLLALLFTVLLANYFIFNHYWKKKQSFETQLSINQGALQQYTTLKAEYDEKISFLKGTGVLDASRSSFYADRIAADIPAAIQLTEMNLSPRVKTSEENEMRFEAKTVNISGHCKQSNELNEWIKTIKKKDFVSGVELINYKQGKTDPAGEFIISVKIK